MGDKKRFQVWRDDQGAMEWLLDEMDAGGRMSDGELAPEAVVVREFRADDMADALRQYREWRGRPVPGRAARFGPGCADVDGGAS